MEKWDTDIFIEGYLVKVKMKRKEGVYYAQADGFYLVAASGTTLQDSLDNLKKVYLRIREVVFNNLIGYFGIEKARV